MGKHQKHQKKLKSEKSKIKLRVKSDKTKFLPKGLNVTDTTFKIKPITLPNQLQLKTNQEPLSKRKLNVKELIQRLKHHNVNVKVENGEELCLVINEYADEILNKHLSELLQSSCHLMLDKERKVRKLCIKLIGTILKNVPIMKIEPLFGVISSFLRCSMSNIDINIQEDSLMLLDTLLLYAPSLVAKDSDRLLTNFLTLVSTLKSDSKPGRTLTVNLGSKLTTVKWKIKVFHRLKGILQSIIDLNKNTKIIDAEIGFQEATTTNIFPLYKDTKYMHSFSLDKPQNNVYNSNESILNQIKSLVTLLHESWLEVAPERSKYVGNHDFTNLHSDAAAILNCILNILNLLYTYVQQIEESSSSSNLIQEFMSHEYKKFMKSLLEHFPYSQMNTQQNKSKIEKILDVQVDPKCLQENLLICYLYCIIPNNKSQEMDTILFYINRCLQNRNYISADKMEYLTHVLRIMLEDNQKMKVSNINQEVLIENALNFYNSSENLKMTKLNILYVLTDVISNPVLNKLPKYHVWLSTLPNLLCNDEVDVKVINKLSLIAKLGGAPFQNALMKKIKPILENVLIMKLVGYDGELTPITEELTRIKVLNMFTYSLKIFKEHRDAIEEFIGKNADTSYANYMKFNFSIG